MVPKNLVLATCLAIMLLGAVSESNDADQERLIGWQGETYRNKDTNEVTGKAPRQWIETVSWSPRAFVWHHFLSDTEADHLMSIATSRLERSQVVGEKGDDIDPIRTSFSASIKYQEDAVVSAIEKRIAKWTHLPMVNGEPLEVLRYVNGQKYDSHWDAFDSTDNVRGRKLTENNRVATVLMYLSDVLPGAGGETALPLAVAIDETRQALTNMSECASKQGISVRPEKGAALLFWDMMPDGAKMDRHALHASCPTFKGSKWTATKWIHARRYS